MSNASRQEADVKLLKDELAAALPADFTCRIRYAHTPFKACEPLFSPLPGREPEETRLADHFLTVSIPVASSLGSGSDVFVFAVEVLIYATRKLTTMFVSKADSTGYLPYRKPSPVKVIATTFLRWLSERQRQKQPERKLVVSLFARAQSQYLFPGSVDNSNKHVLDDRQLIKWWTRVLDPLFPSALEHRGSRQSQKTAYKGYITVPSYDRKEVLRLFVPPYDVSSGEGRHWEAGDPLKELAKAREIPEHAPVRCLLTRFPDDPKARFMQDLDDEVGLMEGPGPMTTTSPSKRKAGRWKTIHDLERFWEAMEFRQECSSGRVVGFLWLVMSMNPEERDNGLLEHAGDSNTEASDMYSQESLTVACKDRPESEERTSGQNGSPKKRKRRPLTGPIVSRRPRLKGGSSDLSTKSEPNGYSSMTGEGVSLTKDGYDKAMQTLLNLDFGDVEAAARSTSKWITDVASISGVNDSTWTAHIQGTAVPEELAKGPSGNSKPQVNDMSGMLRKKRKPDDATAVRDPAAAEERGGLTGQPAAPVVNVLGAGMTRKKPKTV